MLRPTLPLLALAAATALGGCNASVSVGEQNIDAAKLVSDMRGSYEAQTDIDLPRLTCGETAKEVGAKIDCSGRNAVDVELQIDGEITALEGEEIKYRWDVTRAVAPGSIFAQQVGDALTKRLRVRIQTVKCPPKVELKTGTRLQCGVVAANGDEATATIEQTNNDGAFKVVDFKRGAVPITPDGGAAS